MILCASLQILGITCSSCCGVPTYIKYHLRICNLCMLPVVPVLWLWKKRRLLDMQWKRFVFPAHITVFHEVTRKTGTTISRLNICFSTLLWFLSFSRKEMTRLMQYWVNRSSETSVDSVLHFPQRFIWLLRTNPKSHGCYYKASNSSTAALQWLRPPINCNFLSRQNNLRFPPCCNIFHKIIEISDPSIVGVLSGGKVWLAHLNGCSMAQTRRCRK